MNLRVFWVLLALLIVIFVCLAIVIGVKMRSDPTMVARVSRPAFNGDPSTEYILEFFETIDKSVVQRNLSDMPIYVINLVRSDKRRDRIKATFAKNGIDFSFVEAVDGKLIRPVASTDVTHEFTVKQTKVPVRFFCGQHKSSDSEVGCCLSHLIAIKTAFDNGDDHAVVLEDDILIEFVKTWDYTLEEVMKRAPKGWEFINGSSIWKYFDEKNDFVECKSKCWGAQFMLYSRTGMQKILDTYYDPTRTAWVFNSENIVSDVLIPETLTGYVVTTPLMIHFNDTDEFDSTIHTSHTIRHIEDARKKLLKAYRNMPTTTVRIPKTIHLIWLDKLSPAPLSLFEERYPGWAVTVWDDKRIKKLRLINAHFYNSQEPHGKTIVALYEILYRFGGLYIDPEMDQVCGVDQLSGAANFMKENELVSHSVVATVPNHPFLKEIIDRLPEWFGSNLLSDVYDSILPPSYDVALYDKEDVCPSSGDWPVIVR